MPITSSSISSSDGRALAEPSWRDFALISVAAAALLLVGLLATAYVIDPYDTGRSTLLQKPGVRAQGPRTAGASRGRDPAFDAAILGNSHAQLLSPERLKALTGLSFVQLTVPATGPREQLVMLDWFMRHHPGAKAVVIGADDRWCTGDPSLPTAKPFPFWLYSRDPLEYARGLLRYGDLEELAPRLRYLLSARAPRARADGYWDYEPLYEAQGFDRDPALRAQLERRLTTRYILEDTARFPAAERLRAAAGGLSPQTALVVLFPPTYVQLLPEPGSPGDHADRACKAALAEAAASGGNGAVVDWRRERPEIGNAAWFFDQTHYRRPIAELVEGDIARALADLGRKRGG
jgi:hypothetical protein